MNGIRGMASKGGDIAHSAPIEADVAEKESASPNTTALLMR